MSLRHLIVGTAGHIDHGKSALVRALTGTDPDRLIEEQRRGITIELGFADLDLGDGRSLSFVDVPGHERFVRHMVAGATGIDAVVLVIAADQGLQPQTREHLQICSLLEVRRGIVVLSKSDLVDAEILEVVELEARELMADTFLAEAPVVACSARSATGLDDLRTELGRLFDRLEARPADGLMRLPVDRSFVLRGFGTVVTGTLAGGVLREGDEVQVSPGGGRGRVRGLQVHGTRVPSASAGQRTAANLQGLDRDEVPRGSTVTHPGTLTRTRRLLGRVRLLPDTPERLARGGIVRFHQGTAERGAKLRTLSAGADGWLHAEIRLDEPAVLAPGDRFVLRQPAPVDTVGGGVVVDAFPPRRRDVTDEVFAVESLGPERAVQQRLVRAAEAGLDPVGVSTELGLSREQLDRVTQALEREQKAVRAGARWFDASWWTDCGERAVAAVVDHHASEPLSAGVGREALRARLAGSMPQDAWRELLERFAEQGKLRLDGERVAAVGHRVELTGRDADLAGRITARYRAAGLEPPELESVVEPAEHDTARTLVEILVRRGELVYLPGRRLFHSDALERLRQRLREYRRTSPTIDVAEFKRLAGVTRKNAIPLLEQLDQERSTRRVGDTRQILLS